MTSSIENRRDSAKSNGGDSVAVVDVFSVVVQISFAIFLSRKYKCTYKMQLILYGYSELFIYSQNIPYFN